MSTKHMAPDIFDAASARLGPTARLVGLRPKGHCTIRKGQIAIDCFGRTAVFEARHAKAKS